MIDKYVEHVKTVIERLKNANLKISANLDSFFDMCKKYYDHLEVQPQNINNVDESGFSRTRLEENSL